MKTRIHMLFMVLFIAMIANMSYAENTQLVDRLVLFDEAAKNPSFLEFRSDLLSAIESRDSVFLVNHIHEYIVVAWPSRRAWIERMRKYYTPEEIEWGGEPDIDKMYDVYGNERRPPISKEEFIRKHFENILLKSKLGYSTIWDDLHRILSFGGCFVDDSLTVFHAPYTWARWPSDSDYQLAIVKDKAFVYDSPLPDSSKAILDTLSYDLVYRRGYRGRMEKRLQIETSDGIIGYVDVRDILGRWRRGIEIKYIDGDWYITKYSFSPEQD